MLAFGLPGPLELLILLAIAVLVFGPIALAVIAVILVLARRK